MSVVYIEDVHEGDDLSADWSNRVKNAATREFSGSIPYFDDGTHVVFGEPYTESGNKIELYELTAEMEYDNDAKESKALCKPVKLTTYDGDERWRRDEDAETETVWFPAGMYRTSAGAQEGVGHPPHYITHRIYTTVIESRRVAISPPLDLWRFQFKTELTTAVGHATAYPLVSDGAGGYVAYTDFEFEVYDGHKDRYGWPTTEYVQGAVGNAQYYADSNRFEAITIQQLAEEIEVTLSVDIENNKATCVVDHYMRGRDPTGIADSDGSGVLYVYDPQDQFKRALDGAKAKATYDPPNNRYVLRVCQQQATKLRGTLGVDLETTDENITLSAMHVMQPFNGQDPNPAITTVPNTFSWEGSAGHKIIIDWDEGKATPGYIPTQVECP